MSRTTRNVAAVAVAQLVGKLTTFAWTVVVARALTQEDFGAFALAFSTAMLVASVAEWGFDPVLVRRASQQPHLVSRLHSQALAWQTLVGVPVFTVAGAVLWLSRPDLESRLTVLLVLAAVFLDLWSDTCRATSSAVQNQSSTSLALIMQRLVTCLLVIPGVLLGGLPGLAAAFLAGYAVGLLAHLWALRRLAVSFTRRALDTTGMRNFARGTTALGFAGLLSMAVFRLDALLLAGLSGDASVGAYAAAHRLFETSLFATFAVVAALYPLMSGATRDGRALGRWVEVGVTATAAVYLPYAVLTLVEAPALLQLLFGEPYGDTAASTLRWLALAPLAYAVSYLTASALTALERTGVLLALGTVTFVVKLVANLVLIPRYGAAGAGAATVGAFVLEAGLTLLVLRRCSVPVRMLRPVAESALAAILLAIVLWLSPLPLAAGLLLGSAVYLGSWFVLLRLRSPEQLEVLRHVLPGARVREAG